MKTKKKNKKKKKFSVSIFLLILSFLAIIGIGIYFLLTAEDSDTGLTLVEKQWIEKNKETLIDFKIPNNLNILGKDGEGVLYDLIDNIEEDTGLSFNLVPYNYPDINTDNNLGFVVLKNTDKMDKNDLLVAEDSYVVLGNTTEYILEISKINNINIGVLSDDNNIISNYFEGKNINVVSYNSIELLANAIKNNQVSYGIVPRYASLSDVLSVAGIYTNYTLNNVTNKIVLRFSDDDRLNNILRKYVEIFNSDKNRTSLEESLMNFYEENIGLSSVDKATLTSKTYRYGYVSDSVYNVKKSGKLYGVAGEYINTLSNMADIEFEYIPYDTKEDLIKAIEAGNVDIAFVSFDYEKDDKILSTSSPFLLKMVALSKRYQNVSDRYGLINHRLYLLKDNFLESYINDNYNSSISIIKNVSDNVSSDGILILDECEYLYHRDNELKDYKELFTDYYDGNMHFEVNNKEEVLYNLTNFVLNNTDYNEYRSMGINNLFNTLTKENSFKSIYLVILLIVLIPILISIIITILKKLKPKVNKFTKEDVLKYTDMLTSLKNRNYLNIKMPEWNNSRVRPKTVIIIDLNNLKYVNDNYGSSKGNDLIKKAAAILINTQLEKSEMVRSDGNEFMIYLIGYSKTQINTYISKLSKEFENLPYGFGAAIGYSMIEDDIKTLDDAINEATINMRVDKEQNYR